jgi:ATP-dependent Zn protease
MPLDCTNPKEDRQRQAGDQLKQSTEMKNGNDKLERTPNQTLVELDGFDTTTIVQA